MADELDQRRSTERVTVTLIPRAARELARLQEDTAMTRTDLINRAVSLYAFIHDQTAANDKELAIYDSGEDSTQIVYVT